MTEENTHNGRSGDTGNGSPGPDADFDSSETEPSMEDALRRELEDHRDRALRLAAELDNFRKRSAREVENARKFGAERLAQGLLPVRDSMEAGIDAAAAAGAQAVAEGQRATLRLLDEALAAAGVREIDPHGEPFDPAKHEALSMVPAPNVESGSVVQVVQKGYELNERLLRAARVLVAQ